MNIIDIYAKRHNSNRNKISEISGITPSTLQSAGDKSIDQMSGRIIKAVALGTHNDPGKTLNELIKIDGNPIVKFAQNHPKLPKELVDEVEDLIIWLGLNGGNFNNISFNRYYDEGPDTDERAEVAIENVAELLTDFKEAIKADKKDTQI